VASTYAWFLGGPPRERNSGSTRVLVNAPAQLRIKQIFFKHALDHPFRRTATTSARKRSLLNPYLSYEVNAENFEA
jgi:hypothetical protein